MSKDLINKAKQAQKNLFKKNAQTIVKSLIKELEYYSSDENEGDSDLSIGVKLTDDFIKSQAFANIVTDLQKSISNKDIAIDTRPLNKDEQEAVEMVNAGFLELLAPGKKPSPDDLFPSVRGHLIQENSTHTITLKIKGLNC